MPGTLSAPHRRRRHARAAALAVVAALALAGCSTMPPSPSFPPPTSSPTGPGQTPGASPTGPVGSAADPSAVYAAIAAQVEQIRGLQPTAGIAPAVIDQATLTTDLTAEFDKSNPPASIAHSQAELVMLGLLPAGADLRATILAFQTSQVLGYYSADKHQLFVVSRAGGIGPTQRLTYAHEFTHQLQDQHFDLTSLGLDAQDQSDRSLARLSLIEGDAVSVQTSWMTTALTREELTRVLGESLDPAALAALQNAPAILRETSLFPYTAGLAFVQGISGAGGYAAVDAAFARPPASTEQILHPEKYAAGEGPVAVTPAGDLATRLGTGWSEATRDTLGEAFLRIWLRELGAAGAFSAAAGWGGDRLVLYDGPDGGHVVVIETAWDTDADATEFAVAAQAAVSALMGKGFTGGVVHGAGTRTASVVVGSAGTSLGALLAGLPS